MGMHNPQSQSSASSATVSPLPLPLPLPMSLQQQCSACSHCHDTCSDAECGDCEKKARQQLCQPCCDQAGFTMCQIRRHNTAESAWLVADGYVYDVTPYLASSTHPGGEKSILRKCGGVVDCSQDLQFHSHKGKKLWKQYRIGIVKPCPKENSMAQDKLWWMFWK